jgi:hypothetical protein
VFHVLENRHLLNRGEDHYPYKGAAHVVKEPERTNLMVDYDNSVGKYTKYVNGLPAFNDEVLYSVRLNEEQQKQADLNVPATTGDGLRTKVIY